MSVNQAGSLSFMERLSSFRGYKCTKTIGHVIFWDFEQCPYFGGSTIGGSTVVCTITTPIPEVGGAQNY